MLPTLTTGGSVELHPGVTANRYAARCHACGGPVPGYTGKVELVSAGRRRAWRVWCLRCFNRSEPTSATRTT